MQGRTVSRKSISISLLFVVCQLLAAQGQTALPQAGWRTLGDVSSFEKRDDGIEIHTERGNVRITAVSQSTLRVRYSFQNEPKQLASFAVLPQAFQNNDSKSEVADAADHISLKTGSLTVSVYKSPLRI